jgi:GNAT superfamily N-acetyltransferase
MTMAAGGPTDDQTQYEAFMTDLLVKLYDLPDAEAQVTALDGKDILVCRAMACEKNRVVGWVQNQFGDGWAAECELAFTRHPFTCMIAVSEGRLAGFACYDCTCLNFLGPIGVAPDFRKRGVGRALLLSTLNAMAHAGYAYAIVGSAGPVSFFEKCVGALPIPGSTPGIYRQKIKQ